MLSDTLQTAEKDYNPWNLPVDVDLQVRLSQLVALLVTVVTQDDILIAVTQLADGYNNDLEGCFQQARLANPNGSFLCFADWPLVVWYSSFLSC